MATVNTTKGLMDVSVLDHRTGVDEDARAHIQWEEYWYKNELVHRSAIVHIKESPKASADVAQLG